MSRHTRIFERALNRLKLRQLRLLVAVGDHGSIQNAARSLGISQPAATKMIQDLELDFEVTLFERSNRGVVPTVFGTALIRHGKLIFAQLSNATQELDDLGEGNSGRVVVGTLLAAAPTLLPAAMKLLLQDRPKVAIKIVEGTQDVLVPQLMSGELDMIVGRLPGQRTHVVQARLLDDPLIAVVGPDHPLAARPDITLDDLDPFGWILPPPETSLRRQADQFFIKQDSDAPRSVIESVSYLANRTLLRSDPLIALMPAHAAALDIDTGILARLDWPVPFGSGAVGVSHRGADSLSPASAAFFACLQQVAARLEADAHPAS